MTGGDRPDAPDIEPARGPATPGDGDATRLPGGAETAADPAELGPEAPDPGTDRYVGFVHLARGGQGDVFEAFDRRLARMVAIKVLRPDRLHGAEALRHEVGLLVGLEHPGIVPVYDRGETVDGRPWFAMQRLSGPTLGDIIDRMRAGEARWTPRRTLDLLARLAAAVGHAHRRGVGHFDIKPNNVIVGEGGQLHVMDWGIARRIPRPAVEAGPDGHRRTSGTPGYMAPERHEGAAQDARVDVYALGGILYLMLTGRPPAMIVGPAKRWKVGWPDGSAVAPDLIALAVDATAYGPEHRPLDGAAFARRLTDWLDGARRRDEARALLEEARTLHARWRALRDEADELRDRGRRSLDEAGRLASAEAKRPGRALQDAGRARAAEAEVVAVQFVGTVQAALTRSPDIDGARTLLADHHREVLRQAEAERDALGADRAEALVRMYGEPAHIEWLDGPALLDLRTDPPGARVTLSRYASRDRRLVPVPWRAFEPGPLVAEPVPPGSYLAVIEAEGHRSTRCPIHLERGARWDNRPPGAEPQPVRLLPDGVVPDGAVHVPGGWCIIGGDPQALDGHRRRAMWIDDFVIGRTAVTHRAWRDFVAHVLAAHGPAEVEALLPRHRDTASGWGRPLIIRGDTVVFGVGEDGEPLDPETPVALVDHHAARRYARWLSARQGRTWRLPHDLEWEKAARGVDGRFWPWGDAFDPTLTRVAESYAGRPLPEPVGACPGDESPYGVRDMAGLVRTWCDADYLRDGPSGERLRLTEATGPLRIVRGGAWVAAARTCRPAGRFANRPEQRFRTIGVRLVSTVEPR